MTAEKLNVKINVWLSGALFFVGFFIASRANSPAVLYLGYGAVCGFFFLRPDKEYLAAMGVLAEDKKQGAKDEPCIDTKAMVRRPSFWLFFCWTILPWAERAWL